MKKRIMSIALIMALTLSAAPFGKFTSVSALSNSKALTPIVYQTGEYTIVANSLNVRSGPSTSNSKVTAVAKDKTVTVSQIQNGWGKISINGKTGWIDLGYAYNGANQIDIAARLDMLRLKFPDGTYWNREDADVNNSDGYSTTPCANGHSDDRENYFDGTCQCHGFALKLGYDLFGIHASSWTRHYDLSQVKVGDLIRYRARHTVMVTGIYNDYFTVADCNWDYHCGIDWDRTMKKSYISFTDDSYDGIYHCQANGKINISSGNTATSSTSATTTTTKATTTTSKTTTTTQSVSQSGKLTITGDVVNVRSGAGTNYKVVTKVKKNKSYTYTKEKNVQGNKWYYIKVSSSQSGWICGSYVKVTQQLGAENSASAVQKIKVTTNLLNVRSSTSTSSKIITQVKKNSVYTYTDKKTVKGVVWYKIKVSSSKIGWVSGNYCEKI